MAKLTYALALAAAVMLPVCAHGRPSNCPTSPQVSGEIDQTVHAFFDVLRKEDELGFKRLTTTSFYAFDGGKRFSGTKLVELVRDAHA